MTETDRAQANKMLVIRALTGVFVNKDKGLPGLIFSSRYKQHNPELPDGRDVLPALIERLPEEFSYERGMIVAEGDLVMVHGRYVGWKPVPMVAVDIFRVTDGEIAEHWDVLQAEVPVSETVSGNPMFDAV